MKKVTIFIGTPQKRATYQAVQEFVLNLKSYTEFDYEYIFLSDYNLGNCNGCKLCFNKGEEYCPLKDDRDMLLEKMTNSDGVIFATPNYSYHVTALMKNFLDRMGFILHRPRFFGITFSVIVMQGISGGAAVVKYLEHIGGDLGFQVAKGCCLTALEPRTAIEQKKITQEIKKASARFYKELMRNKYPNPSLFSLIMFRVGRTYMMNLLDDNYRDYHHYKEKGWFESDYYYDVSLGFIQNLAGLFFDFVGKRMAKHRGS